MGKEEDFEGGIFVPLFRKKSLNLLKVSVE